MHVLVTGASGFVGGRVVGALSHRPGITVTAATRTPGASLACADGLLVASSLEQLALQLGSHLKIDVIVHAAARVHVMDDQEANPLEAFRLVNVKGTLALAHAAAAAGVKRFVFISSIKVNGEGTLPGKSYQADDEPNPCDPYGISKAEAEVQLMAMGEQTGLEIVVIRPVLVYGPGVKANFLSMMRYTAKGIVLPFGAINNRRSLVALDNLVGLIATCLDHPNAVNQRFLVSDGDDLSTTQLLKKVAVALNRPSRLIPVPAALLVFIARLMGKQAISQRLCGSLTVDISKNYQLLGWVPPLSVNEALAVTAKHFKETYGQ